MSDKKQQVLEAALKCFSHKGFQAASMQDIADELGMAKGSLYFYFKSKDDLLLSVIGFFTERFMAGLRELSEDRQLPPREKLRFQLIRNLVTLRQERGFAEMLLRNPGIGSNAEIRQIFQAFQVRFILWYRQHIVEIYGDEGEPYAWDGAALFGGMTTAYMGRILKDDLPLNENRLANFLMDRLDDVMKGMIGKGERPLLNREDVIPHSEEEEDASDPGYEVRLALRDLRLAAEKSHEKRPEERNADLLGSLTLLEEEYAKPIPDRIIIRGMLAYIKELIPPEWEEMVKRLETGLSFNR
ncbi:TetR/AcrR family transcriptional regulator [Cohnella algarum]|uniref:TetR/AcrR family transcriptional regulator n=1 Tax=Cohnella algarum TaxID=2044859 RepID=UPI001968793D|nr:TetR/AcrR family transcriptional regulator [Cohnella algarum]MBN2981924.1 TetR/AcrR family transcriptional regulator [Cohnella algarum]